MPNTSENINRFFEVIREGDVKEVKKMIDDGYNVNTVFEDGITPLISASHHGHFELVKILVEAGADVNAVDGEYNSPLFCAEYRNFRSIADFLIPLTSLELREIVRQQLDSI